MAEGEMMGFADEDEFLRRVMFADHYKGGLLSWKAFKEKDAKMSWTHRDDSLRDIPAIDKYHAYCCSRAGVHLIAVLRFTFLGLARKLSPPLQPEFDADPDDPVYGHLHCSTDRPRDKDHMTLMAKLVNDGEHASVARSYLPPKSLS